MSCDFFFFRHKHNIIQPRGMSSHNRRQGGWRGKGGRGGHRKGFKPSDHHDKGKPSQETKEVNENCPIVKAFRDFQKEMDAKNDRYERIMKLNRDITIDSKRLIFLLQRVNGSEDCESLLAEAEEKMKELHYNKFRLLAKELDGQDIYQFLKAFSGGLQEYIEAVTFYQYLANQKLVGVEAIESQLVFNAFEPEAEHLEGSMEKGNQQSSNETVQSTIEKMTDLATSDTQKLSSAEDAKPESDPSSNHTIDSIQSEASQHSKESEDMPDQDQRNSSTSEGGAMQQDVSACQSGETSRKLSVPIPPTEYMLGVADFTGELMRMAINSVGAGDLDTPRVIADMMRIIHDAFSTFSNTSRELRRKANVLRQSLSKVERACYTLQVRGSEIPKHMLADVFASSSSMPSESFMSEDVDYTSD